METLPRAESQPSAKSLIRRFGLALLFVAMALVPELLLVKRFFPYPFLFLFLGAVMASAWFGGMAAGLFAVLVSIVAVDYFFIPPVNIFVLNAAVATYLAAFVVCALIASWVSSSKKKSEEALKEARDQLELRVSERTAALIRTQAELAHLSRVLSMGELTASIAHEVRQPLTAVVMHGHACLEWLSADPPKLDKARQTAERIIQEGTRAGAVISRIRALFKKEDTARAWVDMNEVIEELIVFLRDEAIRRHVFIRTELDDSLPLIKGDRVQLQQVVLNLMINGMDAMNGTSPTGKDLLIRSDRNTQDNVSIQIEDCGVGLASGDEEKIFQPFFTTKPHGIGMGLSVSRSIVEAHEGRLWAVPRPSGGTIFQFSVPVHPQEANG